MWAPRVRTALCLCQRNSQHASITYNKWTPTLFNTLSQPVNIHSQITSLGRRSYATTRKSNTTTNTTANSTTTNKKLSTKELDGMDSSKIEVLSLTLHDLLSAPPSDSLSKAQAVELIAPSFFNDSGTENLPIHNEVYFEQIEHEMNDLVTRLHRSIVAFNKWVVTGRPASFDQIDITLLPYAENKFCMYVFTREDYHQEFLDSFSDDGKFSGVRINATDSKMTVQNTDIQNVKDQLKKGKKEKIVQVTKPGAQLMKRTQQKATPARSTEAEQDIIYRLSNTMHTRGDSLVGGYLLQAMEQGCDLLFIDHGQPHALRLVQEQMEALVDTGFSVFVENLIQNNNVLDQQFLHFRFVVLLNKKSTAKTGKPSISTMADKDGKVYIRVFTHFMWAVQHIQFDQKRKEAKSSAVSNEDDEDISDEQQEHLLKEAKGKLQKSLEKRKAKKEKAKKGEPELVDGSAEQLYTCTRLTGYDLMKMIQRSSKQLTGGIMINYGVSKKLCTVANNVTISTDEIMGFDLETALASEPVHRPQ